jgi:hypothetical protein
MILKNKITKIIFCTMLILKIYPLIAMDGKKQTYPTKETASWLSEPEFLNVEESQQFHHFLESLNSLGHLRQTHETLIHLNYFLQMALYAKRGVENITSYIPTNNPFYPDEKRGIIVNRHDNSVYAKAIAELINPFINFGFLLQQTVPGNKFLIPGFEILENNLLKHMPNLPSNLRTTLLEFIQINTSILKKIAPHILFTQSGAKKLSQSLFASHFSKFCTYQEILLMQNLLIPGIITFDPQNQNLKKQTLLEIYKEVSKQPLHEDCDLDVIEKQLIKLNGKQQDGVKEIFVNSKSFSLPESRDAFKRFENVLQTQARIYSLHDDNQGAQNSSDS